MFKSTLSVNSYGPDFSGEDNDILNLRWTSDERELLDSDIIDILNDAIIKSINSKENFLIKYPVEDPYASRALVSSAAEYFDCDFSPEQVYAGSGVSGLLFSLSLMPVKGVAFMQGAYLDLPSWVFKRGIPLYQVEFDDFFNKNEWDMIFIENPPLLNQSGYGVEKISQLCEHLKNDDCYIVVDESYANYLTPAMSCVSLLNRYDKLIVLRGFSKGYGMGSLRLGVMFAARNTGLLPSRILPPLSVSPMSILCGKTLWHMGDITKKLRETIVARKQQFMDIINAKNITGIFFGNNAIPYVFINEPTTISMLENVGIFGKQHFFINLNGADYIYRLSVPLCRHRFDQFITRINKATIK
ncbi:aminotransferase class I/II-fold pyridoxal phosphate-dependent enzyme [Dickeya dianthicola]|nr:aminotransferase class I/II-fold pyridoxal phosphate-dependent enzyme [Dickeya dianthicola]MCI4002824.1 aminotransferase class I/II-fold pyridoxal phosphate-dependent enzyme [Dickeya dianthicola]MCI4187965.1 aminotransferase class I/II-fold pyridoxal phosphate-dependent enzyme [Dickeya dianthicola]MCI4214763.1 aminotransferase class I/II-fold pyridoxal phosphate-dependent enzyme [Dickeya dianthicola]MCI4232032.1 aminotransferase class I/II-fold pyridoxal phosphate-dependent enzyme [Dickeya d